VRLFTSTMVKMVESESRRAVLDFLKRFGPSTVNALTAGLALSANAVKHHLSSLERDGLITASLQRANRGRPARRYALTAAAEGAFPKRYQELLDLVLEQAQAAGALQPLLDGVRDSLAARLEPALAGLEGEEQLRALAKQLDFGGMLGQLERTPGGWELRAFNCIYHATGQRFEEVCDLVPAVIERVTGLPAERPACQRDGQRACTFTLGRDT
jgi:predicted ArsR family transcriptional regulator